MSEIEPQDLRQGIVLRTDARVYHVEIDGEVQQCAPRGKLFERLDRQTKTPVAVGDRVLVSLDGDPPGIEEVLPRRNSLSRVASSHDPREQVLFANVDQLFIIGSVAKPGFSSNRTDRILAASLYEEIPTFLVLNKMDLDRHDEAPELRASYAGSGVRMIEVSATEGAGLDELREALRGKISALYGASGVGKSTLINALEPSLALKVGKVSKYWDAGKHTTSYSQLHRAPAVDGWILDTPGIRVFRLFDITKAELRDLFPEFVPYNGKCQFADCSHDHEPECAVFDAVESGAIPATRYASYVEIMDELAPPDEDVPTAAPE